MVVESPVADTDWYTNLGLLGESLYQVHSVEVLFASGSTVVKFRLVVLYEGDAGERGACGGLDPGGG